MGDQIDYKKEFYALKNTKGISKEVNKKFKKIKEKYLPLKKEEIIEHFENSKHHDDLINICISAFSANSECYKQLGYEFVSTEPLLEKTYNEEGIKNFDLLILNSKSKIAIFVECKTSISRPVKIID
ncbi:MAG: hypothetical protein J7K61_00670, partial [Thermoplasmata archaeon]|nr:hypothetical protein [Thermoplasmata archaeon]